MAALGTYIHGKGLKYGLYSMAGGDCIGLIPGSYDYEGRDAALFAAWGVDLLKYDETCNPQAPSEVEAMQMRKALDSTGRDIVLTSGSGGPYDAIWGYASGAQSVRISGDLVPASWTLLLTAFTSFSVVQGGYAPVYAYGGPNHWLDLDCLVTGAPGITDDEGRTSMALWSIQAAPLLIGADVRTASTPSGTTIATLTNADVIGVDQDALGIIGLQVSSVVCGSATCQVWAKPLSGGACAIGLFNLDSGAHDITGTFSAVAAVFPACGTGPYTTTRDLWAHSSLGTLTTSYTATAVPAHGVAMIRVAP